MMLSSGVFEMLNILGIKLNRNASLNPELCIISIIFRVDGLELIKRKGLYYSFDCICVYLFEEHILFPGRCKLEI